MNRPLKNKNMKLRHLKNIDDRVGNDIVDLSSPHARGKAENRRYVTRVLTLSEQKRLFCSSSQDMLLWTFWAAKESAYKAISKCGHEAAFSAKDYEVFLDCMGDISMLNGFVETPKGKVSVLIRRNSDFIHCVGTTKQLPDGIVYGVKKITDNGSLNYSRSSVLESALVRSAARKSIASNYNKKFDDILIQPSDTASRLRYPEAFIFSEKKRIDISLSHDGRFVAYAFFKKARKWHAKII